MEPVFPGGWDCQAHYPAFFLPEIALRIAHPADMGGAWGFPNLASRAIAQTGLLSAVAVVEE